MSVVAMPDGAGDHRDVDATNASATPAAMASMLVAKPVAGRLIP